jgi:Fe-Mn family superoxide dismutase
MRKEPPFKPRPLTRRAALGLLGASVSLPLMLQGAGAESEAAPAGPRLPRERTPKPLPFDPAKLPGLSERLLRSHHENNYTGALKRLAGIERQIAALPRDAAPFQMGSLKREALIAANSVRLHELYFANLGARGRADGAFAALARAEFGSAEAWEHDFRLTALSLAGGSGWVIATWDPESRSLSNAWAWDHMHGLAGGVPLLVLDMYEHAYHLDYGANARGYLDAFFANLRFDEVNRRLEAATARDREGAPTGASG